MKHLEEERNTMSPETELSIHPRNWTAIEQKRLVRLQYKNRERIVEPHDYGIHQYFRRIGSFEISLEESG